MEVPFYRNFYIIEKNSVIQVEFFEYQNYTQAVISRESPDEVVSGNAVHPCRKEAFKHAVKNFKQHESSLYSRASLYNRKIKL
ncbi:hypothetical protein [Bacillus alveayuensis]|uniref:hypothetical protein n=1 Tax=Aeribacillus alveayuensis TaxID=279215 RepID=UPI0005CD4832|nr:hypothetical protein [Bacillus alveayuensis]